VAELTPPTRDLMRRAEALADELGHRFVGSEHVLLAMVEARDDPLAHRILREVGALEPVRQWFDEFLGRPES
jgi:ATP-dependent Clp protease ATP-binding subunit ClpA